jgi:signal transduction histidine kinase
VTALGRVVRTTAFKLTAIYFAVFSIFSIAFVLYISYSTNELLNQQLRDEIFTEIHNIAEEGKEGGLQAVVELVEQRSHQPDAGLYLITDISGRVLAGNVNRISPELLNRSGMEPITVPYERFAGDSRQNLAMVQVLRLQGGFRMLVGRDIGERERFRAVIGQALAYALGLMILLAIVSWFFVSRRVLKRIDSVSATSRRIIQGDLTGRLEVTGSGDEFDRLAESLNAMLERIETLLLGLKEVSDSIAHDLKTPLTRLRNRVETALSRPDDRESMRAALESTIEESDQLIKTFNALLMIARTEAGSPDGAMSEIDAAAIVRDVGDLFEPAAEEKGIALTVSAPGPLMMMASRELLSQALANLVDNAIKYAPLREGGGPALTIRLEAKREGDDIMLSVADNGPGIAPEDRGRAVQRFVRLERSRSEPGSGLGLSLVAAVARLHHGSIELGDAGPGLVVTMRLPAGR